MSLLNDFAPVSGVLPVCSLITDLRVDIGDFSDLPHSVVEAPEAWGYRVVTANLYNVLPDDVFLFINPTVSAPTIINLPSSPCAGQIFVIKDVKGDASINPIRVQPAAGHTIDGFTAILMNQNKQSIMLTWNETEWGII